MRLPSFGPYNAAACRRLAREQPSGGRIFSSPLPHDALAARNGPWREACSPPMLVSPEDGVAAGFRGGLALPRPKAFEY